MRIERAARDLVGEERAHLVAQLVAFGRQAGLVVGVESVHRALPGCRRN